MSTSGRLCHHPGVLDGRWAEGRSRKKTFPWREGLAFQDAVAWHLIQH